MLNLLRSSLFLSGVLGAATLGRRDGLWQPVVGAKIQMMISGSPAVGSSVVPSDVVSFLSLGGKSTEANIASRAFSMSICLRLLLQSSMPSMLVASKSFATSLPALLKIGDQIMTNSLRGIRVADCLIGRERNILT